MFEFKETLFWRAARRVRFELSMLRPKYWSRFLAHKLLPSVFPFYAEPRFRTTGLPPAMRQSFRMYARHFYRDPPGIRVRKGAGTGRAAVVAMAKTIDDVSYYHFHFDILGMVKTLDHAGIDASMPLVISRQLLDSDLFKHALGRGPLAERNWVPGLERAREFGSLLHPKAPPISRELILELRRLLQAPPPDPGSKRRIYVARRKPATRKIIDSERIWAIARDMGFEVVDAAQLSFTEQMELFAASRYIVLEHGAATANLIYRAGAPVSLLEIFSYAKLPPHAFWITSAMGGSFVPLIGTRPPDPSVHDAEDYEVDPSDFRAALDRLLSIRG